MTDDADRGASATPESTRSAYLRGFADSLPFLLVVAPFGALFGVLATEAGMTLAQTIGFGVLVIAGAAQLAALQLMVEDAGFLAVMATGLAVNMRLAMYSAALVPHLGGATIWQRVLAGYLCFDQTFAVSIAEYERRPEMQLRAKLAYYFGVATPTAPAWYTGTVVGALAGSLIPQGWALDFALPITFLAVVAPMLRTVAHVAAALTSVVLALALDGMPSGTGLILAGIAAMMVGAAVESWREVRE